MSGPNPRAAAVAALVRQEQDGFSNLILDAELRRQKLEGRDKAFASAIFYTVLEHQGTLDYILSQFLPKGLVRLDPQVREILRAALAQARYMQVPASAAVNEAVKLTRTFRKASASGLVNAVLRRAIGYDLGSAVFADEVERLMVLGSAGRDVAAFLHQHYPDEALDILTHTADGGLTSLRANPLKGTPEALCEKLLASGAKTAAPGLVPGSLFAQVKGSVTQLETFRQGEFHVQGQASQYAVACLDPREGQRAADLCAAPGGKSITIAQLMHNTGRLFSCDLQANRLRLIRSGLERCGISNTVVYHGDASEFVEEFCGCDRVLCDVPCSGLGVMGKKPDIRYKSLEGIENLQKVQQKILQNGARYLAQNGRLVYSTCTVNFFENEEQIRQFLAQHPDFCVVPPQIALPGMRAGEYGTLFLPHETGTDGFFVCVLERRMV